MEQMISEDIPRTDRGVPYVKMRDLKSLTGLPGSTIQHYANLGLLPGTVKTETNVAWYPPDTVARIRLIRLLQNRHRLSLAQIGALFRRNATDDEVAVMASLHEVVFGQEDPQAISREAFIRDTGLTSETVDRLEALGLLLPVSDGKFDREDVMVASLARKALLMGVDLEDLTFYSELVGKMVAREMRLRRGISRGLSVEQNSAMTLELTRMGRAFRIYLFDRTFQKVIVDSVSGDDLEMKEG
ncbi:MerR family transcriptional regulator [Desulfoluna spongiiphila]|uniref:MerR family transcriptional regulator n=1 Tax=Desulfoluna spongiiphila TaxID=419481 RepID=UPI0012557D4C|nr:MerR family transcriptional regulator [Desulfoluna spongiiphila]VVS93886.1 merr-type hth domain [Desulfoluna spongiiphila]